VVGASARAKSLKGICAPGVIKQTQGDGATQYANNISVNFQIYNAGLFVLFRFITVAERRYWHIRVICCIAAPTVAIWGKADIPNEF
jgi:hypothetical protein